MGLFSSLFGASSTEWNPNGGPGNDFWYDRSAGGTGSLAGIRVDPNIALQVSAVFACLKVISETIAILPLIVYDRVSDREKRRAYGTPEYNLFARSPNAWQTPYDLKENLTAWAALHGKGIAIKYPNESGTATAELDPVHPSLVRVEKLPSRRLRYWIRQKDGQEKPYVQGEIFHLRGFAPDGLNGVDLSQSARDAIGLARALDAFAARYFANDATVGIALEHPGELSDPAKKHLRESFEGRHQGVAKAWRPIILEEGMKLQRLDSKAKDAQLTEERQNQVIEICRYFRMPPHKIAHLLNATFSNIEHQALEFVGDTITPWAVRWEEAVTRDIIVDDEKYFAEFLLTALLRGDQVARSQYYRERFNIGTLSRNEIRNLENENPIEGGDTYYIQGAMVPIDTKGVPQLPNKEPGASTDPRNTPAPKDEVSTPAPRPPRAAFEALLVDAADRIARAEQRELEKRTDKATADFTRFSKWANEFYATHVAYASRTLAPLTESWFLLAGTRVGADQLAQAIADDGRAAVTTAEFQRDPKPLIAARTQRVAQLIQDAFFAEEPAHAA